MIDDDTTAGRSPFSGSVFWLNCVLHTTLSLVIFWSVWLGMGLNSLVWVCFGQVCKRCQLNWDADQRTDHSALLKGMAGSGFQNKQDATDLILLWT